MSNVSLALDGSSLYCSQSRQYHVLEVPVLPQISTGLISLFIELEGCSDDSYHERYYCHLHIRQLSFNSLLRSIYFSIFFIFLFFTFLYSNSVIYRYGEVHELMRSFDLYWLIHFYLKIPKTTTTTIIIIISCSSSTSSR